MTPDDATVAALRESRRLAALRRVALLDTPAEEAFDRLTRAACLILEVPVALVSLVDADRQFFKSCVGLPEPWASSRETPISHSFCRHTVDGGRPLIIEDAREHPLVRDNLAIRDLSVIAYAGIPLITATGFVLGSFCAIDSTPRAWSVKDIQVLTELAAAAMTIIEMRTSALLLEETRADRDRINERLTLAQGRELEAQDKRVADLLDVSERLQRELLPNRMTPRNDCAVYSFYQPGGRALLLGGDFFDVVEHGPVLHFVIADVAGHGPEAAAFAVALRSAWVALQQQAPAPHTLLERLNRIALRERREETMFVTALAGSYDTETRELRLASAGHHAPLSLQRGRVRELPVVPGPPLGLFDDAAWSASTTALPDGSALIAYTDGLVEGRAAPGASGRVGTATLMRWIERLVEKVAVVGDDLLWELHAAAVDANGSRLPDDVAMLVLVPG